ncbi:MAG: flagellar biosynthetic protein FliO [Rhizobiaceae bacterium]|nr:flagellar biosynthetic protein FliO [Rhizobiaceae bacterium]
MNLWLEKIFGAEYAQPALYVAVACGVFVVLCLLYLLYRRARSGTYVAGGRNRKARLAIMDATAIDTHRRLVLVRRDDVEHLLLIGGHSDIVVESDISVHGHPKRQLIVNDAPQSIEAQPVPHKVQLARTENAPLPQSAHQHLPPPPSAPRPQQAPAVRPVRQPHPAQPQRPVAVPPPARSKDELDTDLLKELETALDITEPAPQPAKPKSTLDEEMAKLLGELSSHKR